MKRTTLLLLLLAAGTAFAATEETLNKTFPVAPGGKLVVDVDFGSIDVATNAAPGEVSVEVWRKITRKTEAEEKEFLRDYPVELSQEGDTVTVRSRHKPESGWSAKGRNRNEGKYTLRVPAQLNASLKTSGGGIEVTDLTGDVKANTSGGGLRFERVKGPLDGGTSGGGIRIVDCEGDIKIRTSGGSIRAAGGGGSLDGGTSGGSVTVLNFAGPASMRTSGGSITMENIKGAVQGSTSGGPVNAVLLSPLPGDVKLTTSGGGVTVKVAAETAFNLDAKTSGGGVSSDVPVTFEGKKKRDQLKGPANGGGPELYLRSSGGGIRIKKL